MTTSRYTLAGFLASPLVAAMALVLARPPSGGLVGLLGWLFIAYILAFVGMCVFGIPLFLALSTLRLIRWWSCAIGGALVGALIAYVIRLPDPIYAQHIIPYATVGLVSALSFWGIWRLGIDSPTRR